MQHYLYHTVKNMKRFLTSLPGLLVAAVVLSGCVDKFNLTQFNIASPKQDVVYVGTEDALPQVNNGYTPLPVEFKVTYDTPPSDDLDIVLNGHNIGQHFEYGPAYATGDIDKFKQFFRQGKNTLSVAPSNFGPVHIFDLDMAGPPIIITRGEITDTEDSGYDRDTFDIAGNKNGSKDIFVPSRLEVEGRLRDFSLPANVMELDLVQITGYNSVGAVLRNIDSTVNIAINADGTFCACDETVDNIDLNGDGDITDTSIDVRDIVNPIESGAQSSMLYTFRASDVHGYTTEKEFLAETGSDLEPLAIQNALRVAVGQTFVQSMKPLVAAGIASSLDASPMDVRCYDPMGGPYAFDNTANLIRSGGTGANPSACGEWDDERICGDKRGVVPGRNIMQLEFDELDKADSSDGETLDGLVDGKPISDASYACGSVGNSDGSSLPAMNPIEMEVPVIGTLSIYVQSFVMNDGSPNTDTGSDLTGKRGTVILNDFQVKANDRIYVDLDLTELIVGLEIPLGGILNIILGDMYIQKIHVESDVLLTALNGDLDVQLENSDIDLSQGEMTLGSSEVCISFGLLGDLCIPLGGNLINAVVNGLKGIIGNLLPVILNPVLEQNLEKLVLGGMLAQPENQTSFDMLLNVDEIGTGTVTGDYDLLVGLESLANVLVADPGVKPSLGPVFFDDPIDPAEVFNAFSGGSSNLSVAINSNLINQSLNAVYAIGASHMTSYNGKIYFGAQNNTPVDESSPKDASGQYTKTIAAKGDTRIRLWPDMPPALTFSPVVGSGGAAEAAITYESATLSMDELVDVDPSGAVALEWKEKLVLNATVDLAVQIDEEDGVFTMGAAGPPTFKVDIVKNNTNIQVPTILVQSVLDVALLFGGDILSDKFVVLDLGSIAAGTINGTEVIYYSADDEYTQDPNDPAHCIRYNEEGEIDPASTNGQANTADGAYDRVCQTIEFDIVTDVVGVIGEKGSNLWFQMQANDPKYPAPAAIPDMDLDGDSVMDKSDNCAIPVTTKFAAIHAAGGIAGSDVDQDGVVDSTFLSDVRGYLNDILYAQHQGVSVVLTGDSGTVATTVQNLADAIPPASVDVDWYNDNMRVDDSAINNPTWLQMLYSNANQSDQDADNFGDLCESDSDRDGVWASYKDQPDNNDNCPDSYNPNQIDTYGNPDEGAGDICNIRQTFVLLKNQKQGRCISHNNFSSSNAYGFLSWATCDQADPGQRFYFKENTAETTGIAKTVVAQLWQKESRTGFSMTTIIKSGNPGSTSPTYNHDDVIITDHANYQAANFNDWIFYASGDESWPYQIKSYKFFKRDGVSSNWCVFDKNIDRPDQDDNSCDTSQYPNGAQNFQILLGPDMADWNGIY